MPHPPVARHGAYRARDLLRGLVALAALLLLAGAGGCEPTSSDGAAPPTGPWLGRADEPFGPSASGGSVRLEDFAGRLLWIDFAAPWCGPCAAQARQIAQLERSASPREVAFLTIMTSDAKPLSDSTGATAVAWARRFGLDPDHVVAGGNPYKTIPEHVLLSPEGEVLFHHVGGLSASRIREVIGQH
jgi:thiol-disulfide isomerase/thioredoxin